MSEHTMEIAPVAQRQSDSQEPVEVGFAELTSLLWAATEVARVMTPRPKHEFKGRLDRGCEQQIGVCHAGDNRSKLHVFNRLECVRFQGEKCGSPDRAECHKVNPVEPRGEELTLRRMSTLLQCMTRQDERGDTSGDHKPDLMEVLDLLQQYAKKENIEL